MVGITCLIDLILYAIAVGKIIASSMGTILHYCRQNFKHNSNFILKMAAGLIELKVWPLCKRRVAESMGGSGHLWMSRNGRIYGWPGPSVDVEKWWAGHPWIHG